MFSSIYAQCKFTYLVLSTQFRVKNQRKIEKSKVLEIKGQRISYVKKGNRKKIIILLHGWGQSKEIWNSLQNKLQKKYTVYSIDLPGFGESIMTKPFSLQDYVDVLNSFILQEKIDSCIIVGHSFGGKIASLFTMQYPQKVKKLVLYSVNFHFSQKENLFSELKSVVMNMLLRMYTVLIAKSYKKTILLLKTYKNTHTGAEFKKLHTLKQKPLLFIYGSYDYVAPYPKNLRQILPDARIALFENSTHLSHLENTKEFNAIVKSFIEE